MDKKMIHLDLFSGIGGFAYAADQVWDNVEHIFCDFDPFCRAVLTKHWPEAYIHDNIKTLDSDTIDKGLERFKQNQTQGQSGQSGGTGQDETPRPFILTGGFPCQPFSAAGLRRGTADARHLWPEMLRVIRLTQPEWVIAENVRGLITWNEGLVFESVCTDLEDAGYEVQPVIIPASALNAPHRRDRIWFIAHAINSGPRGTERRSNGKSGEVSKEYRTQDSTAGEFGGTTGDGDDDGLDADTERKRLQFGQKKETERYGEFGSRSRGKKGADWQRNWTEVAAELCSVDDGLPAELGGLKLSKSAHRKEQLKAYGNAIVPQVAMEIMRGLK